MASFEIPDAPARIAVQAGTAPGKPQSGVATYSVTNRTAKVVTGRLSVQVAGGTKAEWFGIDGERERDFAPGESQSVSLSVTLPPDAPPGEHKFRLRIVAVNDPDNDHVESPVSTLEIAAPRAAEARPGFSWWIPVAGGVALLAVVGFGVTAFVTPGLLRSPPAQPEQPALSTLDRDSILGKTYTHAAGFLDAKGFTAQRQEGQPVGKEPETVTDVTQPSPERIVTVTVDPGVAMPGFTGKTKAEALSDAQRKVIVRFCKPATIPFNQLGKVIGQPTPKGTKVALNTEVLLTIGLASETECRRWGIEHLPFGNGGLADRDWTYRPSP